MKKPPDLYAYIVSEESYPDGAVIIKENSYGNWIYIILKGKAKIKKQTAKGEILIDFLKEGSIFGKTGIFMASNVQRYTSLVAEGPVTLGVLDAQKLDKDWIALPPSLRSLIISLIKKRQEALGTLIAMSVDLYNKINKLQKSA